MGNLDRQLFFVGSVLAGGKICAIFLVRQCREQKEIGSENCAISPGRLAACYGRLLEKLRKTRRLACWTSLCIFCAEWDVGKLGDCSWKLHSFQEEQQAGRQGDWLEKLTNVLGKCSDRQRVSIRYVYAVFQSTELGMLGSFCTIFWRSEAQGHCPVKLFDWPAGGLIDFLVGIADWNGLLRNFCVVLGDSQWC